MARSRQEVISEMVDSGLFTDDDIRQAVKSRVEQPKSKSIISRGLEALTVPEKKSREGLEMIAQAVTPKTEVTGNLPRDITMNLPKIAAETFSETAPGFVSREAILTAGALKGLKTVAPLIKATGRGVAKAAESISGLEYKNPGILTEVAENPKLLFSKGKKAASAVYEAGKEVGGKVRSALSEIPEKKGFVDKALKLAKVGKLNATEALEARKELSSIKKSVPGEYFRKGIAKLNEIAKPTFSEADKVYEQGMKAEELRRLFPVNKMGGTSIMKSALGSLAGGMGPFTGGLSAIPMAAMSPIVQGGTAATFGAAAKAIAPLANNAVKTGSLLSGIVKTLTEDKAKEILRETKGDKEKARKLARERGYEIP